MKKSILALVAVVASMSANAANVNLLDAAPVGEYTLTVWNDVKENGDVYPNFRIAFPENNGTAEAPIVSNVVINQTCTGPNGYNNSMSLTITPGAGVADAHGYLFQGMMPEGDYMYTYDVTVNYLDSSRPATTTQLSAPFAAPGSTLAFNVNLSIAPNGAFVRTSPTSGTLPFIITCTGDVDQVDHYVVRASRAGNEYMDEHNVTSLTGEFTLTDLPANAVTGVWIKVKAVSASGDESPEVQYGAVECSTIGGDALTYSIDVDNVDATSATEGTLDIILTAQNTDEVAAWHFFVVRAPGAGETGDVTVGESTVAASEVTAYPFTTTINLSGLPEGVTTDLWAKCEALDANGNLIGTLAQYPGEAQGWTGLSITTLSTLVNTIAGDNNALVNVYNFSGVCVRRGVKAAEATTNLPAGLYIIAGKKVLVK